MLKIGIVGLPNVGKSTLFNAITNSKIEAANYPFATIEPNEKIIEIKDKRLINLAKTFKSKKIIFNQIQFIDIAGLVKGASKGEGLGNKFLSNIREVDLIIEVVRFFEDKDVIHVNNKIDPINDIEIIETELIISDLEQITNWLNKNSKKITLSKELDLKKQLSILEKIQKWLEKEKLIKDFPFEDEKEKDLLKPFNFLTNKPILYVANLDSENQLKELNSKYLKEKYNKDFFTISIQLEYEISLIEDDLEKEMFLQEYNLNDTGLNELSKKAFNFLNWSTYFTVGPEEAHAWAFPNGYKAPQAAGIIHTDFERGFIKAEIYNYEDFLKYPSEQELKSKGLIRMEGKEYILKDGDICYFRFNV